MDTKTLTFRKRTIREMQDQVVPSQRPHGWPENWRKENWHVNIDRPPSDDDSID
jgi:hypothetical protein